MVYSSTFNEELEVLEQLVDELVSAQPRKTIVRKLFAQIGVSAPEDADSQIALVFDRLEAVKHRTFSESSAQV